jgi:geranylgeranyl diphosphate synthase, type I
MSLQDAFDRFLPRIEEDLQAVIGEAHPSLAAYYGMMRYHLGWVDQDLQPIQANGGKRLRPVLCLLANEASGGNPHQALPAASAIELVHSFSLVHDDIQDGSPLRRGRRAVWDIWGVAHGTNVGDGMFVLARLALHRLKVRGVPCDRHQAATLTLDQACLALCEGQFFDMTFESRVDVGLDQYLEMIERKTAALLAVSAQLGAIVATDNTTLIEHFRRFGHNLGMAFQIQDDILGTWGDEQQTGKSAATDIRDRKKTLPVVYALNHPGKTEAARQLAHLYAQPDQLEPSTIQMVLDILERLDARQYAEQIAEEYYRLALQNLDQAGVENLATSTLRELAASLLQRQA